MSQTAENIFLLLFIFFVHASLWSFIRNTIERYFIIEYEHRKNKLIFKDFFYSVMIHPSNCDFCHIRIRYYALIPVFGFFLSRGKCFHCGNRINYTYPLLEFIAGLSGTLFFLFSSLPQYCFFLVQIPILVLIFLTDQKFKMIPILCVLILFIITGIEKWIFFDGNMHFHSDLIRDLLWSSIWTGFLFFLSHLYSNSLGSGDIYLSFILNLFVGYPYSIILITFAAFIGIIIFIIKNYQSLSSAVNRKQKIPFAPYLIISYIFLMHIKLFFQ